MKVRSNRLKDVRNHYVGILMEIYPPGEAQKLFSLLVEEFFGLKPVEQHLKPEFLLNESELLRVHFAVKDLLRHRPFQYITGMAWFYGMRLNVSSHTLIPRPETEELVDIIIRENQANTGLKIIDLGTGTGCIALALSKNLPGPAVTAVDISQEAIALAQRNAAENEALVTFVRADILSSESLQDLGLFDIIVSNPPYVRRSEMGEMSPNVPGHEPDIALFVEDDDPLLFYRHIAGFAGKHLLPGGKIYVEMNQFLYQETSDLFRHMGFGEVEVRKDLSGNHRFLIVSR